MKTEIEVKFKVNNLAVFRKKLKSIGAKFIKKELEKDAYFGQRIENKPGFRHTLRLRTFKRGGLLTVKGPLLKSKFKKKRELEVKIDDPKAMVQLLHRIGFLEIEHSKKEKIRETYLYRNRTYILLDRLPFIGFYVEIEGRPRDIERTAKALCFDMKDRIKESYTALFSYYSAIYKAKHPERKIGSFTFSSERT